MDGNAKEPEPRGGNKPVRPAPAAADAATQQPADLDTPPALSSDANAAVAGQVDGGQPDVASVDESRGAGGAAAEEDDHDNYDAEEEQQVERFYALLANIRAMRGLPPHNTVASSSSCCAGDTHTHTAGDSPSARKRRLAEPPWRPAFRMEDFEEPLPPASSSSCKLRKLTTGAGESSGSARPIRRSPSSSMSMPHTAARYGSNSLADSRSCSSTD